jgi:hypothetical protein
MDEIRQQQRQQNKRGIKPHQLRWMERKTEIAKQQIFAIYIMTLM